MLADFFINSLKNIDKGIKLPSEARGLKLSTTLTRLIRHSCIPSNYTENLVAYKSNRATSTWAKIIFDGALVSSIGALSAGIFGMVYNLAWAAFPFTLGLVLGTIGCILLGCWRSNSNSQFKNNIRILEIHTSNSAFEYIESSEGSLRPLIERN